MAFITAPTACFIFISHLSNSKINLGLSFLYCILYLGLASLLSFGILLSIQEISQVMRLAIFTDLLFRYNQHVKFI